MPVLFLLFRFAFYSLVADCVMMVRGSIGRLITASSHLSLTSTTSPAAGCTNALMRWVRRKPNFRNLVIVSGASWVEHSCSQQLSGGPMCANPTKMHALSSQRPSDSL